MITVCKKKSKSSNIIKNCKKKSSKTSKNLKRPQKYLFIKDQKARKYSKYCKYKTG